MAKKSFKKGLGSLIQDTRIKKEDVFVEHEDEKKDVPKLHETKEEDSDIDRLNLTIFRLEKELLKWRMGILTIENFDESLARFQLRYNKEANKIEKM